MKVTIFADKTCGEVKKYWTKCVGSCHAAMALREDWRRHLKTSRDELGFEYVRFHGLLNDDMSVCLRKEDGSIEYSFFNVDSIFDFLLDIGMKPFIELSFMPSALASGSKTVFHYHGNITPPKSYDEWADLIGALADHLVRRYGVDEVRKWFFEVWNEPNLDMFWAGTMQEYFRLYQSAALAIKKVDNKLAVGGPATAIDAWIPELREFCSKHGVPLDFISTHHYPTDAAFIVKTITDNMGLLDCYSFWTFSDIFEECGLSSVPFHGGFGLLNIHGIPKPSYRAFQLLSRLSGDRLEIAVNEGSPTVDCFASRSQESMTILISNYQVPLSPIQAEWISLTVKGIRGVRSASLERIDEMHANPKRAWMEMGSPTYLDCGQIQTLMKASELIKETVNWTADGNGVTIDLSIQPHSVVAISFVPEN